MNDQQRHPEIEELLGAYVLDAIGTDERRLVERHLRACRSCEREVGAHQEVAASLVPDEPAPDHMWDAIVAALEEVPPPLELAPVTPHARRGRRSLPVMAVLTAVAAAAVAVLGVRLVDQGRRLDQMQTAMAAGDLQRAAVVALANPTARTVELRAADSAAAARVALLPDGRGFLLVDGLTELASHRTYQLWAFVDGERISAGTLGRQPKFAAFNVSGAVAGFAITEESAPGVVSSENSPVVFGWLRSA